MPILVSWQLATTTRGGTAGDDRGLRPRGTDRGPHPNHLGAARPHRADLWRHLPRPSQGPALEPYPDRDDRGRRRHGVAPLRGHLPARGAAAQGAGHRLGAGLVRRHPHADLLLPAALHAHRPAHPAPGRPGGVQAGDRAGRAGPPGDLLGGLPGAAPARAGPAAGRLRGHRVPVHVPGHPDPAVHDLGRQHRQHDGRGVPLLDLLRPAAAGPGRALAGLRGRQGLAGRRPAGLGAGPEPHPHHHRARAGRDRAAAAPPAGRRPGLVPAPGPGPGGGVLPDRLLGAAVHPAGPVHRPLPLGPARVLQPAAAQRDPAVSPA